MKKKESPWLYLILIGVFLAAIFAIYSWYTSTYFGKDYQEALQNQNPADPCATPPGYTDEEWREHMSHHPDMYKDCL